MGSCIHTPSLGLGPMCHGPVYAAVCSKAHWSCLEALFSWHPPSLLAFAIFLPPISQYSLNSELGRFFSWRHVIKAFYKVLSVSAHSLAVDLYICSHLQKEKHLWQRLSKTLTYEYSVNNFRWTSFTFNDCVFISLLFTEKSVQRYLFYYFVLYSYLTLC